MTTDAEENKDAKQMEMERKLAMLEASLKAAQGALTAEQESKKEAEMRLKIQQEAREKDENEQRRLRFKLLENEDRMRREIEARERALRAERAEKDMTMQLLRQKQDELDR